MFATTTVAPEATPATKAILYVTADNFLRAIAFDNEPQPSLGVEFSPYVVGLDKLDQVQIGQPVVIDGKGLKYRAPGAEFLPS